MLCLRIEASDITVMAIRPEVRIHHPVQAAQPNPTGPISRPDAAHVFSSESLSFSTNSILSRLSAAKRQLYSTMPNDFNEDIAIQNFDKLVELGVIPYGPSKAVQLTDDTFQVRQNITAEVNIGSLLIDTK